VTAFPAFERIVAGVAPERIEIETEASCFYHPQSRASIPCDECGRFLCRLCDLEVEGRHICPNCFASGAKSKKIQSVETRRSMYDTMALALATLPALLIWPALVAAPMALYITIRRWNTPLSVLPRTKIRYILAAFFALGEFAFVIFMIVEMVKAWPSVTR
jgi:hypothetical protein